MQSIFSQAAYTAIISDLHLCEAEPLHPKYPLWKKYKTREFFFDDVFEKFLNEIEARAQGEKIELVLNGDIFDFDSVLKLPDKPTFRISWMERKRGLFPRPERSEFKIQVIIKDHAVFFTALRGFLERGHRVVFVMGNHDLELHFPGVQKLIREAICLVPETNLQVRFVEWFYLSNQDTLIEHGNQYDPYCVCEDPIHPFIRGYNWIGMKLPFGNLACRYILNGLGFFNPHIDSNYIMTMRDYVTIFVRYMVRAQPFLVVTWFWGAVATLMQSFRDRLSAPIRNPFQIEDRVQAIAERANAETRMVRELRELAVAPASSKPKLLMQELWLDRALMILFSFFILYELMLLVRSIYDVSFFWMFIPLFIFLPFFLFYTKSVTSLVSSYKEPDERILAVSGAITKVQRVVYGHTHIPRHEQIGGIEHLNSGCWSPAFLDVECMKPVEQRNYVWICPDSEDLAVRKAELLRFNSKS